MGARIRVDQKAPDRQLFLDSSNFLLHHVRLESEPTGKKGISTVGRTHFCSAGRCVEMPFQKGLSRMSNAESPPRNRERRGSVLIVDDDPASTTFVKAALLEEGYSVETAKDPRAILNKEILVKPDVLLINLMRAEPTEPGLLDALREHCRQHRIKIIAMLALQQSEDTEKALRAGADDYVVKPVRLGELILRINRQVGGRPFPEKAHGSGGADPGRKGRPAQEGGGDEDALPAGGSVEEVDLLVEGPRSEPVKGKILVIDDDRRHLEVVESCLALRGHTISLADGGRQGVALAEREEPDLIILDVRMPDMDGREVSRELSRRPNTAHIPILMLTVLAGPSAVVQGLTWYADDYVTKPYNAGELVARAEALLRRTERLRQDKRVQRRLIQKVVERARFDGFTVYSPHLNNLKDCPEDWSGPVPDVVAVRGSQRVAFLVETLQSLKDERTLGRWRLLEKQPGVEVQLAVPSKEALEFAALLCRESGFRPRIRLFPSSREEPRRPRPLRRLLRPFEP